MKYLHTKTISIQTIGVMTMRNAVESKKSIESENLREYERKKGWFVTTQSVVKKSRIKANRSKAKVLFQFIL